MDIVPYGRQQIDDADVDAVVSVLRGDWLTTGPVVAQFEEAFAQFTGAKHAVAVSNGTAALHLAMVAAGVGPGDEVIVPALTFVASANCARYVGATVVFADVDEQTLTVDVNQVAAHITPRTRAIVAVDFAGLPADLTALRALADRHGLCFVEDGCHAPGATCDGRAVGTVADITTFSFHPVKHVTTAEGGMLTMADAARASVCATLRNHGIVSDARARDEAGVWDYDMVELGFNYRLSDVQCALGLSQLRKLPAWLARRREIAARYQAAFAGNPAVRVQSVPEGRTHAWHLYTVRIATEQPAAARAALFAALRAQGVRPGVHYQPVYQHRYYRELGYPAGLCPAAERAYEGLLSLPMWPGLDAATQDRVIDIVHTELARHV